MDSPERVNQIIRDGFVEIKEKFGDERKTQIIEDQDEIQIEDLIKSEEQIVTITHKGYVKRMAIDTYRTQKRGGTGVKGASTGSDDDFYTDIFTANTHSELMFFTNRGKVFSLKVFNIPEGTRTSKGRNLVNLIQLDPGDKVKEILCVPKEDG